MEGKIPCYCEARTLTKIGMTAGHERSELAKQIASKNTAFYILNALNEKSLTVECEAFVVIVTRYLAFQSFCSTNNLQNFICNCCLTCFIICQFQLVSQLRCVVCCFVHCKLISDLLRYCY